MVRTYWLSWLAAAAGAVVAADLDRATWRATFPEYPNLIYNSSFELPDWFTPKNAEFFQERPNTRLDDTVQRSGRFSLRVEGKGSTFQRVRSDARFPLVPGKLYVLSAWIKTQNATGKGASIGWTPTGNPGAAGWVTGTTDWKKVENQFLYEAREDYTQLHLDWDLGEGGVAWFDDLRLAPVEGDPPALPAPTINPAGGRLAGAVTVEITSAVQDAEIRYTLDGTDPGPVATLYRGPFLLLEGGTLKARAYHTGHAAGAVATAQFDLQSATGPGVPITPIDWCQDVAAWWAGHVFNPKSPRYQDAIRSPDPVVDVAAVRAKHPNSTTAGIAEALALLPAAGGTLRFPRSGSPYVVTKPEEQRLAYYYSQGAVLLSGRSNIHFVSDGAVIRCAWTVFGFTSADATNKPPLFNQPARNFYFKGLVFDGLGKADIAVNFIHCADVLFDDCAFRGYVWKRMPGQGQLTSPQSWALHPAPLVATAMTDNIWVRRSTFAGGMWGVYWDGVHNGGIVDCQFTGNRNGPILIMTNNDMAIFSATQRNAQYIVISGCRFAGGATTLSNGNTLLVDNTMTNGTALAVTHGRWYSNIKQGVSYVFEGNIVSNNVLAGTKALTEWHYNCPADPPGRPNLVVNNRATGLEQLMTLNPQASGTRITGITVRDNDLAGTALPQVRVQRQFASQLGGIVIENNRLRGESRPLVVDEKSQELTAPGVTLRGNRVNE